MAKTSKSVSENDKTWPKHGGDKRAACSCLLVHSAVAFVYSALALAETFVLFAVLILLFALVVRGMIRAFRKD